MATRQPSLFLLLGLASIGPSLWQPALAQDEDPLSPFSSGYEAEPAPRYEEPTWGHVGGGVYSSTMLGVSQSGSGDWLLWCA